jgi:hypothetical protein
MAQQTTRNGKSKSGNTRIKNKNKKNVLFANGKRHYGDCGCGNVTNNVYFNIDDPRNVRIDFIDNAIRAYTDSRKVISSVRSDNRRGRSTHTVQGHAEKPREEEWKKSTVRRIAQVMILAIAPFLLTLAKKYFSSLDATDVFHQLRINLSPEQNLLLQEKFFDWVIQDGIEILRSNTLILTMILAISTIILTGSRP